MIVAVFSLIAAILSLDQFCKFLILEYVGLGKTHIVVKGILSITPAFNTGGGFGILPNQTFLFISISLVTIIYITYLLLTRKIKEKAHMCSLAMILAGAASNLIDRLRFGAVVDFIDFKIWPIFNVADSSITIGVIILMWLLLKTRK